MTMADESFDNIVICDGADLKRSASSKDFPNVVDGILRDTHFPLRSLLRNLENLFGKVNLIGKVETHKVDGYGSFTKDQTLKIYNLETGVAMLLSQSANSPHEISVAVGLFGCDNSLYAKVNKLYDSLRTVELTRYIS